MHSQTNNSKFNKVLSGIHERLSVDADVNCLAELTLDLSVLADNSNDNSRRDLYIGADTFARLLEFSASLNVGMPDESALRNEMIEFVDLYLPVLQRISELDADHEGDVKAFIQVAKESWSDFVDFSEETTCEEWESMASPFDDASEGGEEIGDEELNGEVSEGIAASEIESVLAALSGLSSDENDEPNGEVIARKNGDAPPVENGERLDTALIDDRELLEAYLDDAQRCLAEMERAALAIESASDVAENVQQFCRELHTLKGASGTVGLKSLAGYLHDVETSLEGLFEGDHEDVDTNVLFEAVDRVRLEIDRHQSSSESPACPRVEANEEESSATTSGDTASNTQTPKVGFNSFATNDDSSIRIRATKLDRLMDMLAELVVLRNRRESHVSEFNFLNDELKKCGSRLSLAGDPIGFENEATAPNVAANSDAPRNGSCTFSEVIKDIAAVSDGLKDLQKPVSQDNAAISGFIRDFRLELMQLRRIPVAGLFSRLQRAARDAAKTENKQVLFEMVGENAGLEQEIQERLYDSLLHIVRNAVSHGIEAGPKRKSADKAPAGTLTLAASSSAQTLTIEVRDDGNGLDYAAVQKRAIEKGIVGSKSYAE